jgi:hypothetical protein
MGTEGGGDLSYQTKRSECGTLSTHQVDSSDNASSFGGGGGDVPTILIEVYHSSTQPLQTF